MQGVKAVSNSLNHTQRNKGHYIPNIRARLGQMVTGGGGTHV